MLRLGVIPDARAVVRGSDAIRDSIEIVRTREIGDRLATLARSTEAQTGRIRRGAVDAVTTDGVWRAAAIRVRDPHGRVETVAVVNGVAILLHDAGFDRESVVEALDVDGNVLHTAPLT